MECKSRLVAAFASAFILSGCGSIDSEPTRAGSAREISAREISAREISAGQIVVGMALEPLGFYPLRALDSGSYYAQTLVYDGLLRYDTDLKIVPGVASSFQVSDDGLTYSFTLRPNLKFSDGTPLSIDDVEATLKLARSKGSPFKSDYEAIESWNISTSSAESGKSGSSGSSQISQIVLKLKEPSAALLSRLVELRILPKRLIDLPDHGAKVLSRNPVGLGPYRLVRWESGLELVFTRNEYYFGQPPTTDKLVWRVLPDKTLTALALKRGELDVAQLDAPTWQSIANSPLKIDAFAGTRTVYLCFNTERKPFSDVLVRRAICMSINRQELADGLYLGFATVPDSDMPRGSWAYSKDARHYQYDPKAAALTLQHDHFTPTKKMWLSPDSGKPLAFRIMTIRDYQDVAQVVSDDLNNAGIANEVQIVEYATLRQRYLSKGDFDTAVWSRSSGPDPDCSLVWGKGGALNYARLRMDRMDQLIEAGRTARTQSDRIKAYKEIQDILASELPWVFLVQPELLVAHQPDIANIKQGRQNVTGLPWDNPLFNAAHWTRLSKKDRPD